MDSTSISAFKFWFQYYRGESRMGMISVKLHLIDAESDGQFFL